MALDLCMNNGFWEISFENIDALNSYFIHRYLIITYRSSLIKIKIFGLLSELWPLISVRTMPSFQVISFDYIAFLDSCFIHNYIIIKHRSSLIKGIYFVIYGIISEYTDKGQFQYLTNLKGPQKGTYLYTTLFLSLS